MKFRVFTPSGVRVVGEIRGPVLTKTVTRGIHFHRAYKAWAIQAEALPRLRQLGVQVVRLECADGEILEAALAEFERRGFRREFGPHGEQVFLAEKHWRQIRPPHGRPWQPGLFDEAGSDAV